jgi:hypothetical protein
MKVSEVGTIADAMVKAAEKSGLICMVSPDKPQINQIKLGIAKGILLKNCLLFDNLN